MPATPAQPSAAPPITAQLQPSTAPTAASTQPSIAIPTPTAQPTPTPDPAEPIPIPEDVAFTQITAGKTHACGLRENGAIVCWGRDPESLGSLDAPADIAFTQITAGLDFACGLRQDATIACWGNNSHGQASPPQGSFAEIAAGKRHVCAIPISQRSQSAPPKLICWGRLLQNGAETLPMDARLSDIQSGVSSTCGLTPQADMACVSIKIQTRLTEITPGPFTQLSVGIGHICALRQDGSAHCQGNNYSRQSTPPPTKFAQIAAGWHHACGITRASRIECWGSGRAGAPGERLAAPDGEFVAISIGWRNSCARRPNGRAACWHTPDHLYVDDTPIGVAEAFGGAKFGYPVDILPWQSDGSAIVYRKGIITAHYDRPDAPSPHTILDLVDAVVCCPDESGMLSAALDPQFDEFPFLYVWYSAVLDNALGEGMPGFGARLSRFRVNRGAAIKSSELVILEEHMSSLVHLGGAVRFGADGMLYLGIGDGYSAHQAQAFDSLRGKIIRIDVRGANAAQPYRIPPDNPFADNLDARPEIWAYGMRNPWRMDFVPKSPDSLLVADVGAFLREEVSIATAGANLGWPLCEADICEESLDPALAATLTSPAVAYGRSLGCAIVGGVAVPWMSNGFIFGDVCSRRVWLLERDGPSQDWRMREIANLSGQGRSILSFGLGADGSVYALMRNGPILRLYPDLIE